MKNNVKKFPEYLQSPEDVKHRMERIFVWTLGQYPYPESIQEQIIWIHRMQKTLRDIEAGSMILSETAGR